MNPLARAGILIEAAISARVTPGAALGLVTRSGQRALLTLGHTEYDEGQRVSAETRYDLAGLTKVVATLPCILQLIGSGELALNHRLGRFFKSAGWFQHPVLADIRVRELLTHSAGLSSWLQLHATVNSRLGALAAVLNARIEDRGRVVYSDVGFMILAALIERLQQQRLDVVCERAVFEPLGMNQTQFGPLTGVPLAPTELHNSHQRLLAGEAHDENVGVWDGVAGHAGLFSNIRDLLTYAHAWLTLDPRLAPEKVLGTAIARHATAENGERRGLGWLLACPVSFVGADARGYGHSGFTGASIWVDPRAGYAWVLLSNRVYPVRGDTSGIATLRRTLQPLMAEAHAQLG